MFEKKKIRYKDYRYVLLEKFGEFFYLILINKNINVVYNMVELRKINCKEVNMICYGWFKDIYLYEDW